MISTLLNRIRYWLFVRERNLTREQMDQRIRNLLAEGYEIALLRCQYCEHEQSSAIHPDCRDKAHECAQCHQMMARPIQGT